MARPDPPIQEARKLKHTLRNLTLTLGLSALLSGSALAAPVTFQIDPTHSNVNFRIQHLFSRVQGSFQKFTGSFVWDADKIAVSSATCTIETGSISTNNERRDAHLKSPDFFAADSFPQVKFVSRKVSGTADALQIEGDLTMRGVTRPMVLKGQYLGQDKMGPSVRAGFTAVGQVNRKDFGINWNKVLDSGGFVLSEKVEIELNVEGVWMDPAAAPKVGQ